MTSKEKASKIRASVLGAVLGDSIGAPFEFCPANSAVAATGRPWIDDLYPFKGKGSPHGIWKDSVPTGTGTDDTRYNWLFLELASQLKRMPTPEELASRFLEIYRTPESVFPQCPGYAKKQFDAWEGVCCGYLGQRSVLYPNIPPVVLRERSVGLNYPTLIGLITLTSAGLLFGGRPEEAYAAAYRTDFFDIGYARECVAIHAAVLSLAIAGNDNLNSIFDQVLSMDPYALGGVFGKPFAREHLSSFLSSVPRGYSDQELAEYLSRNLHKYHPFDPFKTLAVAFASALSHPAEPLKAIIVSVNHRSVGADGELAGYQDIDCYGCLTGALAGAFAGADAFPPQILDQVVESNKQVYGFDLENTINRFIENIC